MKTSVDAGVQLVLGPVSDAYGRRNVLVAGLAVLVIASVMIGASTSLCEVYAWRFLQALGGAGSVGVFPMVRDRFGARDGAQMIFYIMALTVFAPMIAPLIGAQVLSVPRLGADFLPYRTAGPDGALRRRVAAG